MLLDLPIFKQTHSWTCLPVCIRMILAYHGIFCSEAEVAAACSTVKLWGTRPEKAIEGVEKSGYHSLWFENATPGRLESLVDQQWPVIVFFRSTDLPHGVGGIHAVVVVGFEAEQVVMADPVLGELFRLPKQTFMESWQVLGSQGMVIWV